MSPHRSIRCILLFFVLMLSLPLQVHAEKRLTVYPVNYPLSYFAERILKILAIRVSITSLGRTIW